MDCGDYANEATEREISELMVILVAVKGPSRKHPTRPPPGLGPWGGSWKDPDLTGIQRRARNSRGRFSWQSGAWADHPCRSQPGNPELASSPSSRRQGRKGEVLGATIGAKNPCSATCWLCGPGRATSFPGASCHLCRGGRERALMGLM